jgi:ABC-2 type transport system ATP-binding protein
MENEPVVILNNVTKRFGKQRVLHSIDGTIQRGQAVGLFGENGTGKTTLLRLLLDAMIPDSGEVRVLGTVPDGTGAIRQQIGYISERPSFHMFMTVGQVLSFRARIFQNWNQERATTYLTRLKLHPQTKISTASKGTLAKLAWICATAHQPQLLLLDEPTSGLDLLVREAVLNGMIHELNEEGKTIFIANHRMEEMMNVIDEVWLLARGRIVRKVRLDELRVSSRRITGRLQKDVPGELRIVEEHRTGNIVSWITLDTETLHIIRDQSLLEHMEVLTVPPEISLRALLKQEEAR